MGTKKSLACVLYLLMLLVAMASAKRPPEDGVICDVKSKTWGGGLCMKHGTCNKPCVAEGFDNGHCGDFPNVKTCYCNKNCGH